MIANCPNGRLLRSEAHHALLQLSPKFCKNLESFGWSAQTLHLNVCELIKVFLNLCLNEIEIVVFTGLKGKWMK